MMLTKNNKKIIVNLAVNYGAKNEILNTFKKIKKLQLEILKTIFIQKMHISRYFD